MSLDNQHLERINHLIELADLTIKSQQSDNPHKISFVNRAFYKEFESLSLSTILNLYGKDHPYYKNFKESCNGPHPVHVFQGKGILVAIKAEIENGWITKNKNGN